VRSIEQPSENDGRADCGHRRTEGRAAKIVDLPFA
jgi:hypothetical protein